MKNIIQQITLNMVEKVLKVLEQDGIQSVEKSIKQLQNIVNPAILEIITAVIAEMDEALVAASKERRKDGIVIKQRHVKRELLTELGVLRYERTYFDTKDDRLCLIDHLIGVEPYERISKELCATLVQNAADVSMAKAASNAGAPVSRQTVNNKVLALSEVVIQAEHSPVTPPELHLFADEDHTHMKTGRAGIVPLVTVTEGIDTSKKRHSTVNAVHFEGFGLDNNSFFEGISSYLNKRYDMDNVKCVYVHADGGAWINKASDWLPNVRRVMDGYHLEKRYRQLSRIPGACSYMRAIRRAVRENDFEKFVGYCATIMKKQYDKGKTDINDFIGFMQNNWDEIVLREQNEVCGSCTEPLVSHILSSRLSRNPLAWSEHGLSQMAMLRVYTQNGGVVKAEDIRISNSKAQNKADAGSRRFGFAKYRAYADQQIKEFLSKKLDWSIFDPPKAGSGKLDASHMLLKAYGTVHNAVVGF